MSLFYNVGKGASDPPHCVIFKYIGDTDRADTIDMAIVGKGVTYDTGGLNIKSAMMARMYGDKGGACAVIGAMQACKNLKLK